MVQIKGDKKLAVFCAETDDLINSAQEKLIKKNADMIVANDLSKSDSGFESDYNTVTIIKRDKKRIDYPKMSKTSLAEKIVDEIIALW